MSEITLVRQHHEPVPEPDREAARRVLFGIVDGLGERGKKQWRRFVNGLMKLEPGEMVSIRTHRERLGWFHRAHMLMESRVFESQERFDNFEVFRVWLKIGAGYCDWVAGPKGAVVPVPRSLSYAKLDQDAMEQVHRDMVAFLRTPHAAKVLWPKLPEAQRADAIELILADLPAWVSA